MVKLSQKLGILTMNAHTNLNKTSKIYSFIKAVIDHQKELFRYVFSTWTWPWSLR